MPAQLHLLETRRLVLEPVTRAHADEAWPGLDDDRMWTFFPELRPRSLEHLRTIYDRRSRGSGDESQIWLNFVCRSRAGGKIVGEVQATIVLPAQASYVAYDVFTKEQGKGYGREAVRVLIDHVAETYGIRRFLAEIDTRNARSVALVKSLGFKQVETHEAVEHGHGLVSNEFVYELTLQ